MNLTAGIRILMLRFNQRPLEVVQRRIGQSFTQQSWSSLAWGQLWSQLPWCAVARRSWDATGRERKESRKVDMRALCNRGSAHTCTKETVVINVRLNRHYLKMVFKASCKLRRKSRSLRPANKRTVVVKRWNRLRQQTKQGIKLVSIALRSI